MALNQLLEREAWARARLAPFAGSTVELANPPFPALRFTILPEGTVEAGGCEPALTVTLKPDALVNLARGPEYFVRSLDAAGDPRLAEEVMALARHLRWDFEEDLARVFGDVAGHRLAETARALGRWQSDALGRLARAFADYAVDEKRILVSPSDVAAFSEALARLRDALERLEKRIERLA